MASGTVMNMATTAASTAAMAMPTGTSHMDMDMGGSGACKISMLWNWNTVDACFISSTWRITSSGMFAGSCIGVICLVVSLEFLRRLGREYDRYIIGQFRYRNLDPVSGGHENSSIESAFSESRSKNGDDGLGRDEGPAKKPLGVRVKEIQKDRQFRPSFFQQMVRALLHMVQFGVAYFIMLLAMYYNGYFIICILIGAFIGYFVFSWEQVAANDEKEVTGCCG